MALESACEHDIVNYGVVGGDGLDVVEQCGVCGERITSESPKTKLENEIKEQEAEERRKRRAVNKRKRTIAEKEEEDENIIEKAKDRFVDLFEEE
jgi:hypothetical protein